MIDATGIQAELDWTQKVVLDDGLVLTVDWELSTNTWCQAFR